jgi:hypothetical protein
MADNKNLQLWDDVCKTDPAFTKDYKGPGGFEGTSVAAQYVIRQATEQWGACGDGWGYEILEDRFDEGGPLLNKEGQLLAMAKTHTIKLSLWYMKDGEKKFVSHYGHTPFVAANKYGVVTDHEAPKKSLTDAIKKCLTMLGFTADIHMGLHDDITYVEQVRDEAALEKADNRIEEKERQAAEHREWLANLIQLIETATNMNELEKLFKGSIRKLDLRKDDAGKLRVTKAKEQRKDELLNQERAA